VLQKLNSGYCTGKEELQKKDGFVFLCIEKGVSLAIGPIEMGFRSTSDRTRSGCGWSVDGDHSDKVVSVAARRKRQAQWELVAAVRIVGQRILLGHRPNMTPQEELIDAFQALDSLFEQFGNSGCDERPLDVQFGAPQASEHRSTWQTLFYYNLQRTNLISTIIFY